MLWMKMRGRTKEENTKFFQDLDPKNSLKYLFGRIVDLDLLSLFPQECARIMGGMRR
jgi:hypothetical protein